MVEKIVVPRPEKTLFGERIEGDRKSGRELHARAAEGRGQGLQSKPDQERISIFEHFLGDTPTK